MLPSDAAAVTAADPSARAGAGERVEISTFDRWHIDAMVRQWCSTAPFADVEPSLIDGLCAVLRLRLERADRAASASRSPAAGGVAEPDLVSVVRYIERAFSNYPDSVLTHDQQRAVEGARIASRALRAREKNNA